MSHMHIYKYKLYMYIYIYKLCFVSLTLYLKQDNVYLGWIRNNKKTWAGQGGTILEFHNLENWCWSSEQPGLHSVVLSPRNVYYEIYRLENFEMVRLLEVVESFDFHEVPDIILRIPQNSFLKPTLLNRTFVPSRTEKVELERWLSG